MRLVEILGRVTEGDNLGECRVLAGYKYLMQQAFRTLQSFIQHAIRTLESTHWMYGTAQFADIDEVPGRVVRDWFKQAHR